MSPNTTELCSFLQMSLFSFPCPSSLELASHRDLLTPLKMGSGCHSSACQAETACLMTTSFSCESVRLSVPAAECSLISFLATYNHHPTSQHMDASLHAIKYIRSTVEYGIVFHSNSASTASAFLHFPFHHDVEAYKNDAIPPTAAEQSELTAYSDACWGSQLGNTSSMGNEIEMFKLCSMPGYMVIRPGGPITWSSVRQEHTSRSSCEAEV